MKYLIPKPENLKWTVLIFMSKIKDFFTKTERFVCFLVVSIIIAKNDSIWQCLVTELLYWRPFIPIIFQGLSNIFTQGKTNQVPYFHFKHVPYRSNCVLIRNPTNHHKNISHNITREPCAMFKSNLSFSNFSKRMSITCLSKSKHVNKSLFSFLFSKTTSKVHEVRFQLYKLCKFNVLYFLYAHVQEQCGLHAAVHYSLRRTIMMIIFISFVRRLKYWVTKQKCIYKIK